jgi:rhodanese-related sulfurtransferase
MKSINAKELYDHLQNEADAIVIDVRRDEEFKDFRIDNDKVQNIELNELEKHLDEIRGFSNIYLICNSGNRSLRAQILLEEKGISAINVMGGMFMWESGGFPVITNS